MFGRIVRSIAGIVAAIAVAFFFVIGVEVICEILWPCPKGLNASDVQACKAHVASLPSLAFIIASVGWGLAVFCSACVATRLGSGRHPAHGIALGSVLLALAVFNMQMLPYPTWFWATNLLVLPAACIIGSWLAKSRVQHVTSVIAEHM